MNPKQVYISNRWLYIPKTTHPMNLVNVPARTLDWSHTISIYTLKVSFMSTNAASVMPEEKGVETKTQRWLCGLRQRQGKLKAPNGLHILYLGSSPSTIEGLIFTPSAIYTLKFHSNDEARLINMGNCGSP